MAVGDPVNARDSDNDRLEYWLWGVDRASFDVDPRSLSEDSFLETQNATQ